ncbi:hypothetical protein [Hyphomonas sp.]|uniref:hypothetical protein n=1 Tax=Hyphomonas sp. TaxID=87 RepID=UPI0030FACF27
MSATPETRQDLEPDDASSPAPQTHAARRDELTPGLSSPGPGSSPGGANSDLPATDVAGEWTISSGNGAPATRIRLDPSSGTGAGKVDILSDWNLDSERPTTWLYLAFGQLTLADQNGKIVWSGQPQDANTIAGAFPSQPTESFLIRE